MLKQLSYLTLATAIVASPAALTTRVSAAQAPNSKVYELRIYTANAGKLADVQAVMRGTGVRLLAKYGIENVFDGTVLEGAPIDGTEAPNMLVCVLGHPSRAAADRAWTGFAADAEWQTAWARAEQAGPLLAKLPVSTYMSTTDFSPALEAPTGAGAEARVFELRKYNTGVDGLPRTVAQFKSGLANILSKNGMTPIVYWTTEDKTAFIYLVAHKDRAAARASWSTFMVDYRPFMAEFNARTAAQTAAPAASAAAAPSAAPSGAPAAAPARRTPDDNRFLVPTDFSPRR